MKKEIAFKSDVIRDVAEELGISEKKVEHIFDFLIQYIKGLTKLPHVIAINIPYIGVLYAKRGGLEKLVNFTKQPLLGLEKVRYKQIIKINNSALDSFNLHWRIPRLFNSNLNEKMNFEELENFQNKLAADGKD